jgi:hypothetical protein
LIGSPCLLEEGLLDIWSKPTTKKQNYV